MAGRQGRGPSRAKIFDAWEAAQRQAPPVRQRDVADAIGVSEAALVGARAAYDDAQTLDLPERADVTALIGELSRAGPAAFLARTPGCELEIIGEIDALSPLEAAAQSADFRIVAGRGQGETSIRPARLGAAFFVTDFSGADARESVQLFDDRGDASLKIHPGPQTRRAYFRRIAELFDASAQERDVAAGRAGARAGAPAGTNWTAFEARWLQTRTRAEIDALLDGGDAPRPTAYRALSQDLALQVDLGAPHRLLLGAAQTQTEVSIRVQNGGVSQTFSGPVRRVVQNGLLLNILDAHLHLQIDLACVSEVWIVKAPIGDAVLTWVDLVGADGASVCQLFGRRPDGLSLCTQGPGCWRALISDFVVEPAAPGAFVR